MKLHMLMVGAAALAFATGAIAQDAAAPATPDATASGTATGAATAPDASAAPGSATSSPTVTGTGSSSGSTAATTDTTGAATAANPNVSGTATAATPNASGTSTAATAPAGDAAATTPGAASTPPQSALNAPAPDPAKTQAADQMIAQNWSKYDKQNTGQLTPLEFGNWVMAAQGNDMTGRVEQSRHSRASNLPATKVLNATAAEFSKADANKDHMISQDELRAYLAG